MSRSLETLLDAARDALLVGDLTTLASLVPEIEAQADRSQPLDRPTAERLRHKAERNARLLQSASRGVKAALGRLSEITTGPTLTTYTAQGRKASVEAAPAQALRRF